MNGERNLGLIREIEAGREFMLSVLRQNPVLLARAEARVRQLLESLPPDGEQEQNAGFPARDARLDATGSSSARGAPPGIR